VKTPLLPKTLLAATFFLGLSAAAWAASIATMTPQGDNTFVATREAKTTFDRDVEKLKAEALDDANKLASSQGKEIKIISVVVKKPWYVTGFPSAKVTFRVLPHGDPELAAPATAPLALAPVPAGTPTVGGSGSTATNDDLYTALLKLDDLRKRGILTEKEFEQEKKKVLDRSR